MSSAPRRLPGTQDRSGCSNRRLPVCKTRSRVSRSIVYLLCEVDPGTNARPAGTGDLPFGGRAQTLPPAVRDPRALSASVVAQPWRAANASMTSTSRSIGRGRPAGWRSRSARERPSDRRWIAGARRSARASSVSRRGVGIATVPRRDRARNAGCLTRHHSESLSPSRPGRTSRVSATYDLVRPLIRL